MNEWDKKRFLRALEYAQFHLEKSAKCYQYDDDPDFQECNTLLNQKIQKIENEMEAENEKWKRSV